MDYDVVVVGAGVVGCKAAQGCAKAGLSVALLEEDQKPGKAGKCTAIVSKSGLDSMGIDYTSSGLNLVYGCRIHSGSARLDVRTKRVQACVLDRFKFDETAAAQAVRAKARLITDRRFDSFTRVRGGYIINCHEPRSGKLHSYSCRVLIGADGANSAVAKAAGFPPIAKSDFAMCYEAEYSGAKVPDAHSVDVFIEKGVFPGFFGWAVPCSDSKVRIGFGTTGRQSIGDSRERFFRMAQVEKYLAPGCRMVREFYALIPLSTRSKTQMGSILLVGDAAGQAKATTGGGLVFGCRCADIAASEVAGYVLKGKPLEYERAWRKAYGRKLRAHRAMRRLMDIIPDALNPPLLRIGRLFGLGLLLARFGDMDEIIR